MSQIKDNIQSAVDKGLFTVRVEINDGKGGTIRSQAETGSLRELGERGQDITHKSGYRAGQLMVECGEKIISWSRVYGCSRNCDAGPHCRRYSCSSSLCIEMVITVIINCIWRPDATKL